MTHTEATAPVTMAVTVRLFALYREAVGQDQIQVAVPAGSRVRDLWAALVVAHPVLAHAGAMMPSTAFAINDTWARPDALLHDGDEVVFLPPVSGG